MLQLKPDDMLIKLRAAPQFLPVCVCFVAQSSGPAAEPERRTQAVLPVHEINS